jgi:hypothetical protein
MFIGCPSSETSCFCGILPSGNYKLRFINYCGETWSNDFTVINIDSLYGIVKLPNQNDTNITTGIKSNIDYSMYSSIQESENLSSDLSDSIKTGIDYNYNNESINIYPNPATNYLDINFERCATLGKYGTSGDIKIFNTIGEIVLTVEQTSPSVHKIDITKLAPGIYFIKIGSRVEKFVKM